MNNSDKHNTLQDQVDRDNAQQQAIARQASKPNEVSGIYYSTHIKISDPKSGEVLVQIRGDQ